MAPHLIRPSAMSEAATPTGAVVVHQLDANSVCWREFRLHPRDEQETGLLYERIRRGFRLETTMVTHAGVHQLGAAGTHAAAPLDGPVAAPSACSARNSCL
jgi:hypothetical protein